MRAMAVKYVEYDGSEAAIEGSGLPSNFYEVQVGEASMKILATSSLSIPCYSPDPTIDKWYVSENLDFGSSNVPKGIFLCHTRSVPLVHKKYSSGIESKDARIWRYICLFDGRAERDLPSCPHPGFVSCPMQ